MGVSKHPDFTNMCLVALLEVPESTSVTAAEFQTILENKGLFFPGIARDKNHQKTQWLAIIRESIRHKLFIKSNERISYRDSNLKKRYLSLYTRTAQTTLRMPKPILEEAKNKFREHQAQAT